ncbi:ComEC/Rec2 family competence protein [Cognatishimia maritima]|uniref:Competence protein ComEC n=1 Tax=Cognatishimia maritima TaxID=870908 RepID=A0A1M5J932_9RHOB|nr:ComEC/Rec2 family competence protein [Cognatishimia maritima]SHG37077.1 competence protein ComEC [Cognatishimia maritima]
MPPLTWMKTQLLRQHGHLFPWGAVCFALGIGAYFAARSEPDMRLVWGALISTIVVLVGVIYRRGTQGALALFPLLILFGWGYAALDASRNTTPRLAFHYYGPVYGRVIAIDRSSSHALRLTLDQVLLDEVDNARTPKHVRVSLHGPQDWFTPMPGQYVGLTGHLSAPGGPVEPDGFDFQRHAWFMQLGAVGYTRTPVLEMAAPEDTGLSRLRWRLARHVSAALGGDVGGIAAAVTTGDRSDFSQDGIEALRHSNLAHLLAISGLHMGLLAGFLFATVRYALALYPPRALRLPVKKIAALLALGGATLYLLLSGASIATQRAYIMAAVALIAVSLDRRALTLRAVAIAALIVLVISPSSLLSPGFQMSFAATAALVAVFGAMRDAPDIGLKAWQRNILAVVMSSLVAGLATAPFAAAHFNQWASYGLLANVTAVPVMGMVVIPGAVLAAVLSAFGLEGIGFTVMGAGLRWILFIAHWVSDLEGARIPIPTPQGFILPLISIAGCWLILWQGALRWGGAVILMACFFTWSQVVRPDVLISEDGKLIGVMTNAGRALSKGRGQGFIAQNWLENDGDAADQMQAAAQLPMVQKGVFEAELTAGRITHYQGKTGAAQLSACSKAEIVVADLPATLSGPCLIFDPQTLAKTGAVALYFSDDAIVTRTVAQSRGDRLWSPKTQRLDVDQ